MPIAADRVTKRMSSGTEGSAESTTRTTSGAVDGGDVVVSQASKKKSSSRKKTVPPDATLSTAASLNNLAECCFVPSDIELTVPNPDERADRPPDGFFTLYEVYFRKCYLWFPIPGAILEFLWRSRLTLSQITPRGVRYLVGIFLRSYECGHDVDVNHLLHFLVVKKVGRKDKLHYLIEGKQDLEIITDLRQEDPLWSRKFFFVRINEASVGIDYLHRLRARWGIFGSWPSRVAPLELICF